MNAVDLQPTPKVSPPKDRNTKLYESLQKSKKDRLNSNNKASLRKLDASSSPVLSKRIISSTPREMKKDTVASSLYACSRTHRKGVDTSCTPECIQGVKLEGTPECNKPVYFFNSRGDPLSKINDTVVGDEAHVFTYSSADTLTENQISALSAHGVKKYKVYNTEGDNIEYRLVGSGLVTREKSVSFDDTVMDYNRETRSRTPSRKSKSATYKDETPVQTYTGTHAHRGHHKKRDDDCKEDCDEYTWGTIIAIIVAIVLIFVVVVAILYALYSASYSSGPAAEDTFQHNESRDVLTTSMK